jgi:hypothetical protein
VRQIVCLIAVLGTLGWLACVLPGPPPMPSQDRDPLGVWRRTAAGWENSNAWTAPDPSHPPAMHPLLAALFLIVGTVGGTQLVKAAPPDAGQTHPAVQDLQPNDGTPLPGRIIHAR